MAAKQPEFEKHESIRKPFKVSGKNKQFRGIVASTLEELKSVACKSLQIPLAHEVKVFLDEDWTAVDNEEYFQFLPAQTKFVVLQQWEAPNFSIDLGSTEIYPSSCLERSESLVTGAEDCTDGGPKLKANTKQRITSDPVFYVNLTDEELEDVIAVDPEAASNELNKTIQEILLYQESCERELSRRSQLRDANELLKLYQRAKKKEEHHGNESVAKKSKVSQ